MIFSLRNGQEKGNVFIWAKSSSKKQFEHANLLLDIDRQIYNCDSCKYLHNVSSVSSDYLYGVPKISLSTTLTSFLSLLNSC